MEGLGYRREKKLRHWPGVSGLEERNQTVRKAFEDTAANQGEDGFDYAKRVQDKFGWSSGGAMAPMQTDMQCNITANETYYGAKPSIFRESDCAHEKTHQAKCRWARDHAAGGFQSWVNDAANYRQNELDAYQAGIDALKNWQQQNGCGN